jgi:hypothetical protein
MAGVLTKPDARFLFAAGLSHEAEYNPTPVVRYQSPEVSDARLVVYDILGREVAVLVNGRSEPGVHEVKFNASGLASGVYFYRLEARQ